MTFQQALSILQEQRSQDNRNRLTEGTSTHSVGAKFNGMTGNNQNNPKNKAIHNEDHGCLASQVLNQKVDDQQ